MSRATYLSWTDVVELNRFGRYVREAFDGDDFLGVFLVGSALRHADYRDVDVRMIVTDEGFVERFGPQTRPRFENAKWNAHCIAWTHFGQSITRLTIDFQIDPISYANDLYPMAEHRRHPIGDTRGPA